MLSSGGSSRLSRILEWVERLITLAFYMRFIHILFSEEVIMAKKAKSKKKAKKSASKRPVKKAVKKKALKKKTAKKKAAIKKTAANKKALKKKAAKKKSATKPKPAAGKQSARTKPLIVEPGPAGVAAQPVEEPVQREDAVGTVTHYYSHLNVAVIQLNTGTLKTGNTIHIKGATTDFTQTVDSMEFEHQPIEQALAGQSFGLRVKDHAREHDIVYLVK
jgi:putative protease